MDSSYIMNFSYENLPVRVTEMNGETWWILKAQSVENEPCESGGELHD